MDNEIAFMKKFIVDNPNLNALQIGVLCACYFEERNVVGLAGMFQVTPPAISRTLDKLEKLKLAKRERRKEDRTSVRITITAKAKRLLSNPKWEI